jgi:parallel beta-helix repeat protein
MKRRFTLSLSLFAVTACTTTAPGDTDGESDTADPTFANKSCEDFPDANHCHAIPAGDSDALLVAVNSLEDGDVVILAEGVYELDNQVTIRAENITFCGQGMGSGPGVGEGSVLDFSAQAAQSNGVDVVGDGFVVSDLALIDAKKDGLRIEDSDGVTIQRVRVTWREVGSPENGAYGIYPVKVSHVLVEDSEAWNSSDAGIYVGQCQHAIVRNNLAQQNVAGIEIENTQYADVYGNTAEDNTGGLVIFDLPGNPVIGHDVWVHDNTVINNNRANFAPGGTVRQIPVGTGTFAMASRRVEISNNTYMNNDTLDVAVISGLVIEGDETKWELTEDELVGDLENTDIDGAGTGTVTNFRSDNIYVHDNTHSGSGTNAIGSTLDQELGILLALVYGNEIVDSLVYGAVGESMFSATDPAMNSNDNLVCIGTNEGATFASLNIEWLADNLGDASVADLYRPDAPYAPFDCDGFANGPIVPPDM